MVCVVGRVLHDGHFGTVLSDICSVNVIGSCLFTLKHSFQEIIKGVYSCRKSYLKGAGFILKKRGCSSDRKLENLQYGKFEGFLWLFEAFLQNPVSLYSCNNIEFSHFETEVEQPLP